VVLTLNGIYSMKSRPSDDNGRVCAFRSNEVSCIYVSVRSNPQTSEQFKFEIQADSFYTVDQGDMVYCNINAVGPWEKFKIVPHEESKDFWLMKSMKTAKYCVDVPRAVTCDATPRTRVRGSSSRLLRFATE